MLNITSLELSARYVGGTQDDRASFGCAGLDLIPGTYTKEVGADGSVQFSLSEPPSVLVFGTDVTALQCLGWSPTHFTWKDEDGSPHTYEVHGISVAPSNQVSFAVRAAL